MKTGHGTIEIKTTKKSKANLGNVFAFMFAAVLFGSTFSLAILGGF